MCPITGSAGGPGGKGGLWTTFTRLRNRPQTNNKPGITSKASGRPILYDSGQLLDEES